MEEKKEFSENYAVEIQKTLLESLFEEQFPGCKLAINWDTDEVMSDQSQLHTPEDPYNAIYMGAATPTLPLDLVDQLTSGVNFVVPVEKDETDMETDGEENINIIINRNAVDMSTKKILTSVDINNRDSIVNQGPGSDFVVPTPALTSEGYDVTKTHTLIDSWSIRPISSVNKTPQVAKVNKFPADLPIKFPETTAQMLYIWNPQMRKSCLDDIIRVFDIDEETSVDRVMKKDFEPPEPSDQVYVLKVFEEESIDSVMQLLSTQSYRGEKLQYGIYVNRWPFNSPKICHFGKGKKNMKFRN